MSRHRDDGPWQPVAEDKHQRTISAPTGDAQTSPEVLFVGPECPARAFCQRLVRDAGLRFDGRIVLSSQEAIAAIGPRDYRLIIFHRPSVKFNASTTVEQISAAAPRAVLIQLAEEDDGEISSKLSAAIAACCELRQEPTDAEVLVPQPQTALRILLVEDSESDALIVRKTLGKTRLQHALTRVDTLASALTRLEADNFDLVLTDLALPDAHGTHAVETLAQAQPDLPILVLTATDGDDIAVETIRAGAQESLLKQRTDAAHLERSILMAIERKRTERLCVALAYSDQLTGLANRTAFRERFQQILSKAERLDGTFAVVMIDLDGFKPINDNFGHAAGDEVLATIAERLLVVTREYDTVARLGGDEFAIIVDCDDEPEAGRMIAERVLKTIRDPISAEGKLHKLSSSIGLATYPNAGTNADALLEAADAAMYAAKRTGKDQVICWSRQHHHSPTAVKTIETQLRSALEADEFLLEYQPVVELSQLEISSLEAIWHWTKPDGIRCSQLDLSRVLESSGLCIPVGAWVIEHSCERLAGWKAAGLKLPRISVKISPRHLEQGDVARSLSIAMERYDIEPDELEIEITESVLDNDAQLALANLRRVGDLGVRVTLDEFGTARSSLYGLHRFPIDTIKIDRSFVETLGTGTSGETITQALIELGQRLDLEIVAAGIERLEHIACLQAMGCTRMQGNFIGPANADWTQAQFDALLAALDRATREHGAEKPALAS